MLKPTSVKVELIGVSIPFKREGAWKASRRHVQVQRADRFQFPSNGKEHGKQNERGRKVTGRD